MQLCIRAHDLGVKGTEAILRRLDELSIDGVQMVCYKAYDDIPYTPGAVTVSKADKIGSAFRSAGKAIPLVGAYFNPVHSNKEKRSRCFDVFADYLMVCSAMGCRYVGSETGSYSDDPWVYHPQNRTEEAVQAVAETFSRLCDVAAANGSMVALEGAAGHVCHDPDTLAKARKMIGKKTRVVLDLYNFMDTDNQGDYLKILDKGLDAFAGDIQVFHMKDCFLRNGKKPVQTPFGKGGLDLHAILRRIKAYDSNAALVLEETTGDDIEHAVKTIRNIWESV